MEKFIIESNWFDNNYDAIMDMSDKGSAYFKNVLGEHNCPMEYNEELHESIINAIYVEDEDITLLNDGNGWDFERYN